MQGCSQHATIEARSSRLHGTHTHTHTHTHTQTYTQLTHTHTAHIMPALRDTACLHACNGSGWSVLAYISLCVYGCGCPSLVCGLCVYASMQGHNTQMEHQGVRET